MKNKTLKQFKGQIFRKRESRRAYEDLAFEFELIEAIIAKRIRKGLTQEALAKKVGMKQSAIARLESGGSNPTLAVVQKVSSALGVKIKVNA